MHITIWVRKQAYDIMTRTGNLTTLSPAWFRMKRGGTFQHEIEITFKGYVQTASTMPECDHDFNYTDSACVVQCKKCGLRENV